MVKRRKRRFRGLGDVADIASEIADAVGGPVMVCTKYRKGAKGYRCAHFEPTSGERVSDPKRWVDWEARAVLKKGKDTYRYLDQLVHSPDYVHKKRGRKPKKV